MNELRSSVVRRACARLTVVFCVLAVAGPAIAYVCHPDPAGTRSLPLHGRVLAYLLRGNTMTIALSSGGTCRVLAWRTDTGRVGSADSACHTVMQERKPLATPARVRLVSAGVPDRPDRINVLGDGGRLVHSWPLPVRARPRTLQVSGGLAAFGVRGGSGLWVMRLADGRASFVAPVRGGNRPVLSATGVVYQDNVYKGRPADRPLLKFIPTRALHREFARVGHPLRTGGPIRAFSMDGTRVAVVVAGGAGSCDRVVFWDIPWRSVEQVSEKHGPTCEPSARSGQISSVAMGGARAQWVTLHRGRPMLVAADDIGCQEWVIRRLSDLGRGISLAGIAADRGTLAFALVNRSSRVTVSDVGRVTGTYRARGAFRVRDIVGSVSADSRRIAVLTSRGSIDVRTDRGASVRSFLARGATSLALGGNVLAATTGSGHLLVYSVLTGKRLNSWTLPVGAGHVDLQYGIAVVTAGRSVYAMNVANGRTVRLAMAPVGVRAQIEPIGVVYAYSTGGRGTAKLVPMSHVESAVR